MPVRLVDGNVEFSEDKYKDAFIYAMAVVNHSSHEYAHSGRTIHSNTVIASTMVQLYKELIGKVQSLDELTTLLDEMSHEIRNIQESNLELMENPALKSSWGR